MDICMLRYISNIGKHKQNLYFYDIFGVKLTCNSRAHFSEIVFPYVMFRKCVEAVLIFLYHYCIFEILTFLNIKEENFHFFNDFKSIHNI